MPTEVLVMCARCGRPQPARPGNCVACGELLPDAPLPAASESPFLRIEGVGGRSVMGVGRKLTYQARASAPPVTVELGNLRAVVLVRRASWLAVVFVVLALVLGFLFPASRLLVMGLAGLGVLGSGMWRRYSLSVRTLDGGRLHWSLGWIWLGARRTHELERAWASAAEALGSRGIAVMDSVGPPGSGA